MMKTELSYELIIHSIIVLITPYMGDILILNSLSKIRT